MGEKGEGSGGEGGGKWGRRGREVGGKGRELGMGYPPVHPLKYGKYPQIQIALYPHIPKLIQVSCIPLNIYKNIPYPFKFLANTNIPVSLKTLPGPHFYAFFFLVCFFFF